MCLLALAVATGSARAQPLEALRSTEAPPQLVIAPLEPGWDDRLVVPLVQRLRNVGQYAPVRLRSGDVLNAVLSQPTSIGLTRRSELDWERLNGGTAAFANIGPAACLVLAVAPDAPWRSYSDLNYPGTDELKFDVASATGLHTLAKLRAQLPLRVAPGQSQQSLPLGLQHLLNGTADVLAFEVVRPGQSSTPPATLVQAMDRGIRLLEIPTHLLQLGAKDVVVDSVPLEEARFWRAARSYTTLCDPFVMVFASAFADNLLQSLYGAPTASSELQGEAKPSLYAQIESAIRSLIAMLRAKFES